MKKITELTQEQNALMATVRDEWIEIALCGDSSINTEDVEAGIAFIYSLAKLAKPHVVITDSPFVSVMAARVLGAKDVLNTNYMGLGYWSGWSSYYDFFERIGVPGVAGFEPLQKWLRFIRAGVWDVLLFERLAFVSRRPELVKKDDQGRLHNPDGPAVRFRDGFSVHAWRGTTVPAEWIESKDRVDPSVGLTHPNIEQRRAFCEILGWDRVLANLKPRVIQEDKDPQIGTLIEVDLPDAGASRFLRVECGTGRKFVLPVPNEMKSAREANAWTYGLTAKQFNPEIRT